MVRSLESLPGSGSWRLRLAWAPTEGLWTTLRVPGQCLSFCDDGTLVHAALQRESTAALAVAIWPASGSSLAVGNALPYMVRQRAPRAVLRGPVSAATAEDGCTVLTVQCDASDPVPKADDSQLLYLGAQGPHPLRTCAMETDASRGRVRIAAVESVTPVPSSSVDLDTRPRALRPALLSAGGARWTQLTQWLAVGVLPLPAHTVCSGVQYRCPGRACRRPAAGPTPVSKRGPSGSRHP